MCKFEITIHIYCMTQYDLHIITPGHTDYICHCLLTYLVFKHNGYPDLRRYSFAQTITYTVWLNMILNIISPSHTDYICHSLLNFRLISGLSYIIQVYNMSNLIIQTSAIYFIYCLDLCRCWYTFHVYPTFVKISNLNDMSLLSLGFLLNIRYPYHEYPVPLIRYPI